MKFKPMEETHMQGLLTVEQDLKISGRVCDLGIMIDEKGRVWVCVDGTALIRFCPTVVPAKKT